MNRVEFSAQMTITGTLTAGALLDMLETVPKEAKIRIESHKGDQKDPGYSTINATWDAAQAKPKPKPVYRADR